jgi:protein SCO1
MDSTMRKYARNLKMKWSLSNKSLSNESLSNKSLSNKLRSHLLVAVLCLLLPKLAAANETLPYYNSAEFTPHWLTPASPELEHFHKIPSFSFINQDGKIITNESVENKIYVSSFFFTTCPGICPSSRSKLAKVQNSFINDADVMILAHSINPTTDTVKTLKKYANEHGIKSDHWQLLTGDKDKIYDFAKRAYFASDDLGNIENTDEFLHTENLLLIDRRGYIRGVYNGLNTSSVDNLIADIRTLKTVQN